MKLLFLHRYGPQAASFRYRFQQYFDYLKGHGYEIEVQSFFSDSYLQKKFRGSRFLLLDILHAFFKRILFFLRIKKNEYHHVILYKDALPYLPYWVEYYLLFKNISYSVDIDDALYLNYEKSRNLVVRCILGGKFKKIFKHAKNIFAGNAYLEIYARQYNKNVVILPTVIDLKYYRNVKNYADLDRPLVIGWMGSPSTALSLKTVKRALSAVQKKFRCKIKLVGSGAVAFDDLSVEIKDWKSEDEISDLLSFDIGIMPLEDTDWNRGKCGFKLIQYMACGIPVVGSAVGVNQEIIDHGKNGFLAANENEWVEYLSYFFLNQNLIAQFSQHAREKIVKKYSTEKTSTTLLNHLTGSRNAVHKAI